jgi:hypothetical protein
MAPRRTALLAVAAVLLAVTLAFVAGRPPLERALRARLESEAARRGLMARIETVHLGLWPPVRIAGVEVEPKAAATSPTPGKIRDSGGMTWRLHVGSVEAWWRGRPRLVVRDALLEGPAGATLAAQASSWEIQRADRGAQRLALVEPQEGLILDHAAGAEGTRWKVEAIDLPIDRVFELRQSGRPQLQGGKARGTLSVLAAAGGGLRFEADLAVNGVRLPALSLDENGGAPLGEPADVALRGQGTWNRGAGTLEVQQLAATLDGAALTGALSLHDLGADASIDVSLEVERLDFGRLLRTAGLGAPEKLGRGAPSPGGPRSAGGVVAGAGSGIYDADLGVATIAVRAQGRRSDPASFQVTQRVDFTPPAPLPEAIEKLRGPFVHEATLPSGATHAIEVAPASPDFVALQDVPPLFVRALLLAEDAGFYGHPGIDLREMPAAILTDIERGGAARGASTITQQLAKNLFLSHDKVLGRKLQELSCALLLESALGKSRILEIYLNVIEWGPDLYGLRPATRAYFDREPRDLSPAQMAFLVALIPAPVKYQVSFAHGTPGPGLRQLVDAVLAKLRSVDALTEEEYRAALAEEIVVRNVRPDPARTSLE